MRPRLNWYILVASGSLVLITLVGSVVVPQVISNLTPKHEVVFSQLPNNICGGGLWALPWAVTLGNTTTNVTLENTTIRQGGGDFPSNLSRSLQAIPPQLAYRNLTRIVFSVPDGNYHYVLMPAGDFWDPYTAPGGIFKGTVHVQGHAVVVNVTVAEPGGCG